MTTVYRQDGVARSAQAIEQGQKTVGSGTVQLTSTSTPCSGVWIGAPTANHTVGALNDGNILIGGASGGNASGGRPLERTNHEGVLILINDASKLYLTGFNAGDVAEYQIYR